MITEQKKINLLRKIIKEEIRRTRLSENGVTIDKIKIMDLLRRGSPTDADEVVNYIKSFPNIREFCTLPPIGSDANNVNKDYTFKPVTSYDFIKFVQRFRHRPNKLHFYGDMLEE